ncbi:MAG TPA: response regulator [Jatrophihabitantaceae bacterium]|jgi:two-component system chemotaxis response regulator CheY|nr:response regulator [Jatrophihabitantaceae bacterium]
MTVHAIVIDDSSAMRMILRRIVTKLGFEVDEAVNGRDALDKLNAAEQVPDVALIDWNMPEMNGLEFIQAVRSDPRYSRLTLLMVTTESEQSQIVRALAAGAHEYLIKPFTPDAVAEKLEILGLTAGV